MRKKYYDFFIVSVLFTISMFLRLYRYTEQAVLPDEITYSLYAYSILSHNWSWPPDFMWANPPLLPYLLATITYLYEGGLDGFRLVSIFFGSLSVCVIYFLGKSLYNRWVGLLSAILLCFSSFHILYSRTVMIEALWIFLAYASMYFFWKSYNKEGDIKYAFASGVFLGLADDAKFNAFLLYISYVLFILWIKKRSLYNLGWKTLVKKKYLLLTFVSILIFSPVLITLHINNANPFYWHLFGRYKTHSVSYTKFDILNLLKHGFDNYVDMLIDGHSTATLSIPWLPVFYLAASFFVVIIILLYFYILFKSQNSGSFLIITFIVFNTFVALFGTRFQYYLLWGMPAFFIMMSNLVDSFINQIKLQFVNRKTIFSPACLAKIFTLVFACIFIFSYIVIGIMAPSVNKGHMSGYEEQVIHLKNMISPGESIVTSQMPVVIYYFNKYDIDLEKNNIHVFPIYKYVKIPQGRKIRINLELIESTKPRFLIVDDYSFYFYVRIDEHIFIQENYITISKMKDVTLYERKN